jgi:hypothetical protein
MLDARRNGGSLPAVAAAHDVLPGQAGRQSKVEPTRVVK